MTFLPGYDPSATKVAASESGSEGLSPNVWKSVRPDILAGNPDGYFRLQRWDDWLTIDDDPVANDFCTGTRATAGQALINAANLTGATGTVLQVDPASSTDTQGITLQFHNIQLTPKDGFDIVFEARFCVTDAATMPELYAGLCDTSATATISGGAMNATDWIGFYSLASGSVIFGVEDGTQSVTSSAVHTMVNYDTNSDGSEWVKLGFVYHGDQRGGNYYVNNVKGTQSITWSAGPTDVVLWPTFVCQSNGTVDPIMELHWFAVAQVPSDNA